MEIIEVTDKEYSSIFPSPYFLYGSSPFNILNFDKCERIHFLLFRGEKYRLGIIAGARDNSLFSPFSAPFGGFTFISPDIRIQYIEDAIGQLSNWASIKEYESLNITLPPEFYGNSFVSKQINCLWRAGFSINEIELNYSFEIERFNDSYSENIWRNARKNLSIAKNAGLDICHCEEKAEKIRAYDIIKKNRKEKGFPLRMTWNQIEETTGIIPADFIIVKDKYSNDIASAIVFYVNERVVQVIYWGDLPEYSNLKPMNFLSYKLFEFYKRKGISVIDIGPSTENSIPNYGLGEFKESIGCTIHPKYSFKKVLR